MNLQKLYLIFFITALTLFSCGKVTQEFPKAEKKHSFELSFSIQNISKQNKSDKNIKAFHVSNPIHTVIKGYKDNESDQLAYGKMFISENITKENLQKKDLDKKNTESIYTSKSFDVKGKEIQKKPIFSQIKGTFISKSASASFKTPNVSTEYDMYLIAIYSDKSLYKMAFLDQETVSKNIKVNLDSISDFDTFQSVLRLAAFHNLDYSKQILFIIETLFDFEYFTQFPTMPSFYFHNSIFNSRTCCLKSSPPTLSAIKGDAGLPNVTTPFNFSPIKRP